jgi:GNAT superfamily N-acetyltransferase
MINTPLTWINANTGHSGQLEFVDRLCFDLNWTSEAWKTQVKEMTTRFCRIGHGGLTLGFWCGRLDVPENKDDFPTLYIVKLGVHPSWRNKGLSRAIIRDIRTFARNVGPDTKIKAQVCESLLNPKWRDCYIGGWLDAVEFRPVEPFLVDCNHSLYGIDFDHAFVFELAEQTAAGVFSTIIGA